MKTLKIKNFDIPCSNICLGTAGFGGSKIPEESALRLLDVWKDVGGTIVDTANVYGRWVDGSNMGEKIIGKWLATRGKHSLTVATKCCHWSSDAPEVSRVREHYAKADIEESLGALGLDCADICWLHRDDEDVPVDEIVGFCEEFISRGLIRSYGFSNWKADRVNAAYELCLRKGHTGLMGVQNEHAASVLSADIPKWEPTVYAYTPDKGEFHRKSGIAELPYSAIGNGVFCIMDAADVRVMDGKVISVANESRITDDFAARWFSERNLRRYGILRHYARELGMSMFEACVAFHTSRDYTDVPIIATSRELGIYELAAASERTLPLEVINAIEEL
ncbi:MAG: aldo/keto reductase [Oscillospiraceae bacterium]|nr:aldo/keto reductase [Oscillospiraceae bacterium]